jgi:hypothetical protein
MKPVKTPGVGLKAVRRESSSAGRFNVSANPPVILYDFL